MVNDKERKGSIYLNGNIYYYSRYLSFIPAGKKSRRILESLSTRDKKKAIRHRDIKNKYWDEREEKNALYPSHHLAETIKEYLSVKEGELNTNKRAPSTYIADVLMLHQFRDFVVSTSGNLDVRDIREAHIDEYVIFRENNSRVKSSSTISINLRVIRSFFSYCKKKKLLDTHPFEDIKIASSKKRTEYPLGQDFENIKSIVSEIINRPYPQKTDVTYGKHRSKKSKQWIYDNNWFPYVIWIILHTGMRLSEVLNLKWQQGKGDTGEGHSHSYSYLSADLSLLTIHSKKKRREISAIHLTHVFEKIPRTYVKVENKEEVTKSKIYVFENETNPKKTKNNPKPTNEPKPHLNTTAATLWKKFVEDFELNENWTIHSLRHGVASKLLNSGKTHFQAGDVLGHSTKEMIDRYGHGTPKSTAETLSIL